MPAILPEPVVLATASAGAASIGRMGKPYRVASSPAQTTTATWRGPRGVLPAAARGRRASPSGTSIAPWREARATLTGQAARGTRLASLSREASKEALLRCVRSTLLLRRAEQGLGEEARHADVAGPSSRARCVPGGRASVVGGAAPPAGLLERRAASARAGLPHLPADRRCGRGARGAAAPGVPGDLPDPDRAGDPERPGVRPAAREQGLGRLLPDAVPPAAEPAAGPPGRG